MRLSESLRRGIMKAYPGYLMNTFKLTKRRNVLFFEDIIANYIKKCEESGHGNELKDAAKTWARMSMENFTPDIFRNIPKSVGFALAEKVWQNIGLVEKLSGAADDDTITLRTKNESITRIIGKNKFMEGIYEGFLEFAYRSDIETLEAKQGRKTSIYRFRRLDTHRPAVSAKTRKDYERMNISVSEESDHGLKTLIHSNIFQLREGNRIYFRGKPIMVLENTLFHLIGKSDICMGYVSGISQSFFGKIITRDSGDHEKLVMLKTIIQAMGWGQVKIAISGRNISLDISNPPYGLQKYPENYSFLSETMLGFMCLIHKNIRIARIKQESRLLKISYTF